MALDVIDERELSPVRERPRDRLAERVLAWSLDLLASRCLVWVVVLAGAAGWGYTVIQPTWLRIVAVLGYCISIVLPVLWRDGRRD